MGDHGPSSSTVGTVEHISEVLVVLRVHKAAWRNCRVSLLAGIRLEASQQQLEAHSSTLDETGPETNYHSPYSVMVISRHFTLASIA